MRLICVLALAVLVPTSWPGRASALPASDALFINFTPVDGAFATSDAFTALQTAVTVQGNGSTATYFEFDRNGTTPLPSLSQFDQIWIVDGNSSDGESGFTTATDQMAHSVASWFYGPQNRDIIFDARFMSSFYSSSGSAQFGATTIPHSSLHRNEQLVENYYSSLAVNGGGIMLATDHFTFAGGINRVNDWLGVSRFYGRYFQQPLAAQVNPSSPLMQYPGDASAFTHDGNSYLWALTSVGEVPVNEQSPLSNPDTPSGSPALGSGESFFLFPAAFNGGNLTSPSVSTTIVMVPEPATALLLAIGLGALGARRRMGEGMGEGRGRSTSGNHPL